MTPADQEQPGEPIAVVGTKPQGTLPLYRRRGWLVLLGAAVAGCLLTSR